VLVEPVSLLLLHATTNKVAAVTAQTSVIKRRISLSSSQRFD
jgi:hypothetical protein